MKSFIRRLFTDIIGLVFVLAAIFKLMDPVGTGLIVDSYLGNWGIGFLRPLSKVLGECLSFAEAVTGIALLTGVCRCLFAWISTALVVFFTGISVWLVIADPDMSCGCFGEVVALTHSQTLIKNVILAACCIPAFVPYRNLGSPKKHRVVAFWAGLAIVSSFAIYSLFNVPLADYTEFAPSNSVAGAGDGPEMEHSSLQIWDRNGTDVSDVVLEGNLAILSFYSPDKSGRSDLNKAAFFAQDAQNAGFTPLVLSSGEVEIPGVDTYFADRRKLMTLNRFNGGATFLVDGYIVCKASPTQYMSFEEMEETFSGKDAVEAYIKAATERSLILQGVILVFLAVLILV